MTELLRPNGILIIFIPNTTSKISTFHETWLDASLLLRIIKPLIEPIVELLNNIISYLCRTLNYEFPNRFFSPYIFAIGKKV